MPERSVTIPLCRSRSRNWWSRRAEIRGALKFEMQHPAKLSHSMYYGVSRFGGPEDEVYEGLDGAAPVQSLTRPCC